MKTKFTLFSAILITGFSSAQVGFNTTLPKTTVDVSAKEILQE
ncbi:hypothetical protein QWZ06_09240 [Chryseobacterium tructae]|nr:hypothetical protein [Chryseobacterium tructae]MDN3692443.1 hypothetical protein [Chryseobacterium tructae]